MSAQLLLQPIDIFIASSSDVAEERKIILQVIEKLNRLPHIREKYLLRPLSYDPEALPAAGDHAPPPVDHFMGEPAEAYLVICVLWADTGTEFTNPENGEIFQAQIEYAFVSAYRTQQQYGKPHILVYRKIKDAPETDPNQQANVDAFFARFDGAEAEFEAVYRIYDDLTDFEENLALHIEMLLAKHPPQDDREPHITGSAQLEIVEETRRLDAAMPRQIAVNQPIEVWVQICLPESKGFQQRLSQFTRESDATNWGDMGQSTLGVAFPIDSETNEPVPSKVSVELTAPDFTIEESQQTIALSPKSDSGLLVFRLAASRARRHSIVHVALTSDGTHGKPIVLGSTALSTEILSPGVKLAKQVVWALVSLPLAAVNLHTVAPESSAPYELFAQYAAAGYGDQPANALGQVITDLIGVGRLNEALDVTHSIDDSGERTAVLRQVAARLVEVGGVDGALAVAHRLDRSEERDTLIEQVVVHLVETADFNDMLRVVFRLMDSARERDTVLRQVLASLVDGGRVDEALEVAYRMDTRKQRTAVLRLVAEALSAVAPLDNAWEVAHWIVRRREQVTVLGLMVEILIEGGRVDDALEVTRMLNTVLGYQAR